jgi:hypothetical protein
MQVNLYNADANHTSHFYHALSLKGLLQAFKHREAGAEVKSIAQGHTVRTHHTTSCSLYKVDCAAKPNACATRCPKRQCWTLSWISVVMIKG